MLALGQPLRDSERNNGNYHAAVANAYLGLSPGARSSGGSSACSTTCTPPAELPGPTCIYPIAGTQGKVILSFARRALVVAVVSHVVHVNVAGCAMTKAPSGMRVRALLTTCAHEGYASFPAL